MAGRTPMSLNLSAKLPMLPRITRMTYNSRSPSTVEMMQFISVPFIWDLQTPSQRESCSILDRNTWPLPVFFAMMRLLAITNSRNTIHFQEDSFKEIKPTRDARPWLMICTSLSQIKSSRKPLPNSHMDQPSSKVSYGRITLASNH